METVLQGTNEVVCYLDDLLVTGTSKQEHFQNLEVLCRLKHWGFGLKKQSVSTYNPLLNSWGLRLILMIYMRQQQR